MVLHVEMGLAGRRESAIIAPNTGPLRTLGTKFVPLAAIHNSQYHLLKFTQSGGSRQGERTAALLRLKPLPGRCPTPFREVADVVLGVIHVGKWKLWNTGRGKSYEFGGMGTLAPGEPTAAIIIQVRRMQANYNAGNHDCCIARGFMACPPLIEH